jgi:hypothetical protein
MTTRRLTPLAAAERNLVLLLGDQISGQAPGTWGCVCPIRQVMLE